MTLYIVVHHYKKDPAEFEAYFAARAMVYAKTMAAGQSPARCIKTWDPSRQGRLDYLFCLWEADRAEDVQRTLQNFGLLEFLTADIMQVGETDWAQLAQAGS
jgi:hypothetical protein